MNWTTSFKTAAAIASVSVLATISPAFAQEADSEDKPAAEADAVAGLDAAQAPGKAFHQLVRCARVEGRAMVRKPVEGADWIEAEEGRFYPLGSSLRAVGDATATFEFGEKALVELSKGAEIETRPGTIGEATRGIAIKSGHVRLDLPRKLPDGLFSVAVKSFKCVNLAGESAFDYATESGDGEETIVRCVTGTMAIEGANFSVKRMGAANQLRIRATGDNLFTSLRGESGDCRVTLDQGVVAERDFETGGTKDVPKSLEFVLSPKCAVKIYRAQNPATKRIAVSTMTFNAAGDMVNRFVFAEGLSSVNSGELVINEKIAAATKAAKSEDEEEEGEADAKPAKNGDDESKNEKKDDEDSGN